MLKFKEEFESDPGEEKHIFLAVDGESHCSCCHSIVGDSRTTEGRHVYCIHWIKAVST